MVLLERLSLGKGGRFAAFWSAYAIVTLVAAAIYLRVVPSPDQSIFDYMAWLNLHGVPFYKGSFDMTWPGQLVFHELFIVIFGVHWWTPRAGDLLLLQPAVLAIFLFLRRAGFAKAAIGAALLYPIIYVTSGGWMAGHRDFTGAHFLIAAAVFALPSSKPQRRGALWAGLLIGYATMIRPTYLLFAPLLFVIALAEWLGRSRTLGSISRNVSLFGLGVAAPAVLFALIGTARGTLNYWYYDSIRFVTDVYGVPESRLRLFGMAGHLLAGPLWWLTIAGGLGALLWLQSGRARTALALTGALLATVFVSYFVQNKGFGYHLAGVIPLLAMLACAGAEAAFRLPLRKLRLANALTAAVAVLLLAGTGLRLVHARPVAPDWGRQEQERPLKLAASLALTNIIRTESTSSDTMLQWGWEYQVSFLAQRRSPTRLVNVPAAKLIRPGQAMFGSWLADFATELRDRPPKFMLIDQAELAPAASNVASGSIVDLVKQRMAHGYTVRAQKGRVLLLERIGPSPTLSGPAR